jgi:transposase
METTASHQPTDWREGRRLRVWELHQKGWKQRQIAEALGLTQGAVSQIVTRAKQGGPQALKKRKAPGAKSRLTKEQIAKLLCILQQGAQAAGFAGEVWTCARIAQLIQRDFGVVYHPDHIGRLLRACGWSYQKPVCRATQRKQDALQAWTEERLPALKKGRTKASINSCL